MKIYEICNKNSNHSFGFFQANSEKDALEQLAKQAGYNSYREACAIVESTNELVVISHETARSFVEKYFGGDLDHGLFLLSRFLGSRIDCLEFPDVILDDIDPAGFQEFCDAHNF